MSTKIGEIPIDVAPYDEIEIRITTAIFRRSAMSARSFSFHNECRKKTVFHRGTISIKIGLSIGNMKGKFLE